MRIKSRDDSPPFRLSLRSDQIRWSRVAGALALVLAAVVGLYLAVLVELPAVDGTSRDVAAVAEQIRARVASNPQRLVLDIKQEHFQRIRYARERALADGIHLPEGDDYVPAELRFEGQTLRVQVRLKGVYSFNWSDRRKWSLLLKVRGEETVLGMKRFAIQHPAAGDYLVEWLFNKALEDEDLLAQRYGFVDVVINGDPYGIYALHEHYGKLLVEHGRRREGPIVGFNKDLLLEEYRRRNRLGVQPYNVDGAFWGAFVDGIQTGKLVAGSSEEEQYLKAQSLLEAFRLGRLEAAEVFDVRTMATALALKALFGAYEFDWKDLKLYYNPVLGRLEPIVAEVHHQPRLNVPGWWLNDGDRPYMESFTRRLFEDQEFFTAYVEALDRLSRPEYLEGLISRHGPQLEANFDVLHRDYPDYDFSPRTLVGLQRQIRTLLEPLRALHAYYSHQVDGRVILELGSVQHFPVEVLWVVTAAGERLEPVEPAVLAGKRALAPVAYRRVAFALPDGAAWSDSDASGLTVVSRLSGTQREYRQKVFPWPHLREDLVFDDPIRSRGDFRRHEFLLVDEEAREIRFLPGRWDLRRTLVLPAGYRVEGGEGLQINLLDGASLISYSPVFFQGTEDEPVVIESADGTGQGLAVIGADGESHFDTVLLRNLSAPDQGGWRLTGAVTFYESDVTFDNCLFAHNRTGDDLVNLVRSRFRIDGSLFLGALADALDADFCEGTLSRTRFQTSGNDGIDTSGSRVQLSGVLVDGAGDKALSFGEASVIQGTVIRVTGSRLGVASKDLSSVDLRKLTIEDTATGLAAYRKKPEFGPGSLRVEEYAASGVGRSHLLEEGSSIVVERESLEVNSSDTARILEPET